MRKPAMGLFFVGIWIWIWILGCAAIGDMKRLDRFNDFTADYGRAMRWSDFKTVNSYRKDRKAEGSYEKVRTLEETVQVVSYDVRDIAVSADHTEVRQVVEIRYFKLDRMVEKTLKTEEVWTFDETQNRWALSGDFPVFE